MLGALHAAPSYATFAKVWVAYNGTDSAGCGQPATPCATFQQAQANLAAGGEISEYHLQAGISACHAIAGDYESTDWRKILSLYDRLIEFDHSPVVELNRAVAVANVRGPEAGLEAVRGIRDREKLDLYYLLYAVTGELEMRLNNREAAAQEFLKAFELAETKSERAFLLKRLQICVTDGKQVRPPA